LAEKQIELARLQQEVDNLANEHNLRRRIIDQLPELAAHMPDVQELRVLQTGPDAGVFDALATFLAKLVALAQTTLGGSAKPTPPENA
jgi:hypothetical protein